MIKFENFNLDKKLIKAIYELGYENPLEVQQKVIPLVLDDMDVIVKSQTGSGKTASFAIPLINKIDVEDNSVQILVLTPTRELAVQIKEEISSLGLYKKIKAVPVYGKEPVGTQRVQLKQRVHVVVGTPGRTMDHINKGNLDVSTIKCLVLDEADEMLNMGFIEQVQDIIKLLPKKRQTLMFSATMSEEIKDITEKYMINPKTVEINSENLTVERINQGYYSIREDEKFKLLRDIIKISNINQCVLFCRTKKNVIDLSEKMKHEGYSICEIHGDMEQKERLQSLNDFKNGKYTFIVATDVAARGIHMEGVTHVINYDIPLELEAYVHRIGRTGRAGKSGEAITFVTPYEERFLHNIEEFIDMKILKLNPPSKEALEECKDRIIETKVESHKVVSNVIKIYIPAGKKKKIRRGDIVGSLSNEYKIPADSIGIIDIFDHFTYVDILNGYGKELIKKKEIKIKGKFIEIEKARE